MLSGRITKHHSRQPNSKRNPNKPNIQLKKLPDAGSTGTGELVTTNVSQLTTRFLSCCYTNAQGIRNKLPELLLRHRTENYAIIALTETWLNADIYDAELTIPGMNLVRTDRDGKGGGVALYHNQDLSCVPITSPELDVGDTLFCNVTLNDQNHFAGSPHLQINK